MAVLSKPPGDRCTAAVTKLTKEKSLGVKSKRLEEVAVRDTQQKLFLLVEIWRLPHRNDENTYLKVEILLIILQLSNCLDFFSAGNEEKIY